MNCNSTLYYFYVDPNVLVFHVSIRCIVPFYLTYNTDFWWYKSLILQFWGWSFRPHWWILHSKLAICLLPIHFLRVFNIELYLDRSRLPLPRLLIDRLKLWVENGQQLKRQQQYLQGEHQVDFEMPTQGEEEIIE
jgi:hypothetical protein